jgi:mycothiol synthase
MTNPDIAIAPFDIAAAGPQDWAAFNAFRNRMLAERAPDDPPRAVADTAGFYQNPPPIVEFRLWVGRAMPGGELVAQATLALVRTEENAHLAQADLDVAPDWRRRGIGRRLLACVTAAAAAEARTALIITTYGAVPAGAAFLQRLADRPAMQSHTNRLMLADVDRALLRRWQVQAQTRAQGYTLGFWDGPYPQQDLADMVKLTEAANLQPHDDLAIEDFHLTAQQLRETEDGLAARGVERWTCYVRAPDGALAGYSELLWNHNRPAEALQDMTAVWPARRGHGLGRWLKAAMLEKLLAARPQVAHVRTNNADSNGPMLRINQELGFRPYRAESVWQIEVARAQAYLRAAGAAASP